MTLGRFFRSRQDQESDDRVDSAPVLELLALEGEDAGNRFTIDGDEVLIGRQLAESEQARGILLRDATVSSRQALIKRDGEIFVLHPVAGTTNPTLLDGDPFESSALRVGAKIRMGGVLLEVCQRSGVAISGLTHLLPAAGEPTPQVGTVVSAELDEETRVRPRPAEWGRLHIERGKMWSGRDSFPVVAVCTTLGRSEDSHVRFVDMGVSRKHAELVEEGGDLLLVHKSRVNPTLLNGVEVSEPARVQHGDVIQLADRVVLRVERYAKGDHAREKTTASGLEGGLGRSMEERIEIDREIEQRYSVEGSFLDLDVVSSYDMKADSNRPDHIVASFERFRKYVADTVEQFEGLVLNSNGDELMCFFKSPLRSLQAGCRVLDGLDDFNRTRNLLETPFRFRIGIHSGRSLVDLDQGVAYSPILDSAGHLQKLATPNGLLISDSTLEALPAGLPFELAGTFERAGFEYYRLVGALPEGLG
ncbi:MAG: FHA domain-containing protein [Myxococcota bacterium]|nr:FHA domain-containing protein [Myxococcota bacterium]